jgi:hypothetical protein
MELNLVWILRARLNNLCSIIAILQAVSFPPISYANTDED